VEVEMIGVLKFVVADDPYVFYLYMETLLSVAANLSSVYALLPQNFMRLSG
jgi:hypothetical protein